MATLPQASGLADSGSAVFVSAENTGTIDEINTGTLTAQATGASGLVDALDLVYSGGFLWSTETQNESFTSPLYRIDPTNGAVTTYPSVLGTFVNTLFADPGNANEFLASTSDDFSPSAQIVTVSAGVPTAGSTVTLTSDGNPLTLAPDGSVFTQNSTHLIALSSSTLQPDGVQYTAEVQTTAVAASSGDGGVIAYNSSDVIPPATTGFSIYRLGNPADLIGTTAWPEDQNVEPNGLSFSPDGMTVFVVTYPPTPPGSNQQGNAEFHALATNALPAPAPFLNTPPFSHTYGFGSIPVGAVGAPNDVTLQNLGPGPDVITGVTFSGADPDDFVADPSGCNPSPTGVVTLAPDNGFCDLKVYFLPGAPGPRSATMTLDDNETAPYSVELNGTGTEGYYEAGANGAVFPYGNAVFAGDLSKTTLAAPIVSMTLTADGAGYWLLGQDGGVFSYGDAQFHGSTGGLHLNKPVVGMAATPDGGGYWLDASDGGIFSYGDAQFYGSTGAIHLNKPIVGMAATPDGGGYWLVASDGGIFAYGDAQFYGSTGAIQLNEPIVAMTTTPDGGGYWLVASDGGIFAYGDAQFYGSTGAIHLNKPIVGMAIDPDGGRLLARRKRRWGLCLR